MHGVDSHVSEHRQIVRSVAQPGPVLVLVHDHVQPPVQAVFHAPVLANHLVETLRRERPAEQIVRRFRRGFRFRFTHPHHLSDGLQAGPLVLLLEPASLGGDRRRASLDASMIGLNPRRGLDRSQLWIVQQQNHIVIQRALIALQRKRVGMR